MTLRNPVVLQCPTYVSVDDPIKSTYLINKANFVACHSIICNKIQHGSGIKRRWNIPVKLLLDMEEVGEHLPGQVKALHR